jgi:fluoride exporter
MGLIFVAAGGALGAVTRYLLATYITTWFARAFAVSLPYGTAFVNVTGSFLLALFLAWEGERLHLSPNIKLMVGTGFFGAYTTFSTYANESITLIDSQNWTVALGYILVTNVLCLGGVVLGLLCWQVLK